MAALSNSRHERFAQEVAQGHSATEAYETAGYKPNRQAASRLLSNVDVQARVQELQNKGAERAEVTIEQVVAELYRMATVDIAEAYNEDGSLKPIHKMPVDVRRAISGVDVAEISGNEATIGYTKKLRFWDKKGALELLGKHLGMFVDRHLIDATHRTVTEEPMSPEDWEQSYTGDDGN